MSAGPDARSPIASRHSDSAACPLCGARAVRPYHRADQREYVDCARCRLIFVPPRYWPTRDEERARYDQHRNAPADAGYRAFLSRPFRAVLDRVPPPATGLDFGSGPGPTLSTMLEEAGYAVSLFDVYYAPERAVLDRSYDFITCTEVIEHLHEPTRDLRRLVERLVPGGWLIVQTQLLPAKDLFTTTWRYRRDPTHVAFYSVEAFRWLADLLGCRMERPSTDVFALRRSH
jgi:SAM-dependent methyltransferase